MQPPLRFVVYEFLKSEKNATDDELLEMMNKLGVHSINELNKVLLQLEIMGLIDVRWVGKDKRRVEVVEPPQSVDASRDRPS